MQNTVSLVLLFGRLWIRTFCWVRMQAVAEFGSDQNPEPDPGFLWPKIFRIKNRHLYLNRPRQMTFRLQREASSSKDNSTNMKYRYFFPFLWDCCCLDSISGSETPIISLVFFCHVTYSMFQWSGGAARRSHRRESLQGQHRDSFQLQVFPSEI